MKNKLESRINEVLVGILLKNPFIGNFLSGVEIREDSLGGVKHFLINNKNIIFYNKESLMKLNKKEIFYVLMMAFYGIINNDTPKLSKHIEDEEDLLAMNAALNSSLIKQIKGVFGVDKTSRLDIVKLDKNDSYNDYVAIFEKIKKEKLKVIDEPLIDFILPSGSIYDNYSIQVNINDRENLIKRATKLTGDTSIMDIDSAFSGIDAGSGGLDYIKNVVSFTIGGKDELIDWKKIVKAKFSLLSKNNEVEELIPMTHIVTPTGIIPYLPVVSRKQIKEEFIDVAIAIDVSSSITMEELNKFVNEIFRIFSVFKSYRIHIWTFSGQVNDSSYAVYTDSKKVTEEEFGSNYVIGGGTLFNINYEYMKEKKIMPKLFITLTDGYPFDNDWGDSSYCDSLFLVYDPSGYYELSNIPKHIKAIVFNDINK